MFQSRSKSMLMTDFEQRSMQHTGLLIDAGLGCHALLILSTHHQAGNLYFAT
ncbi:hypothetical protein SETIT_1G367900v2 [Setaria italica]|uniref:Uncharacterized protein n=1 Tax=Setaria italica TaxID=4555 RepID=A0A368PT35_SETIT|nr:hypothetical protein SETIT_1G367900v2 [Setaria italica]